VANTIVVSNFWHYASLPCIAAVLEQTKVPRFLAFDELENAIVAGSGKKENFLTAQHAKTNYQTVKLSITGQLVGFD